MNIHTHGQSFTKIAVINGGILPHSQNSTSKSENHHHSVVKPKPPADNHILPIEPHPATSPLEASLAPIDLSNMTPIEFRQLIHSELARERHESGGSLDVMPYWKNRYDSMFQDMVRVAEGPADQKMDILGVIQKAIDVKTSNNKPVELLEQTLEKLKLIDGQAIPYRIDLSA